MSENIGKNMILVIKFLKENVRRTRFFHYFYLVFNLFDNIGNKIKTKKIFLF